MAVRAAFQPAYTQGQTKATSVASGNTKCGEGSKSLVVTNLDATDILYVRVGKGSALVATAADYLILPRSKETISKNQDDDYVAYIAAANTPSVNIIPGEGY